MVGREMPAADASCSCDQPISVRAAFICLIDTFSIDIAGLSIDTKSIDTEAVPQTPLIDDHLASIGVMP